MDRREGGSSDKPEDREPHRDEGHENGREGEERTAEDFIPNIEDLETEEKKAEDFISNLEDLTEDHPPENAEKSEGESPSDRNLEGEPEEIEKRVEIPVTSRTEIPEPEKQPQTPEKLEKDETDAERTVTDFEYPETRLERLGEKNIEDIAADLKDLAADIDALKKADSILQDNPEGEASRRKISEAEFTVLGSREGWVQQEGDEKVEIRSSEMSGEADGARFEHSVDSVKAETPLGEVESDVKRTSLWLEGGEDVEGNSVQRMWRELERIEEDFEARPKDEETAIRQYITAVNPILELLEKEPGENVSKKVITVYDRGENERLRKTDYVLKTVKWWKDEEGVTHVTLCRQEVGYERAESPEKADRPWGRAVTYKFKFGVEKEQGVSVETSFVRFNPEVTMESREDGKRKEEKRSAVSGGSSSGAFEAGGESGGQKALLTFYRDEGSKEPEDARVEHTIYRVVHEPPPEEPATTSVAEVAKEANEPTDKVKGLEGTSDNANGTGKNAESVERGEKGAVQPQQAEKDVEHSTNPDKEAEDKKTSEEQKEKEGERKSEGDKEDNKQHEENKKSGKKEKGEGDEKSSKGSKKEASEGKELKERAETREGIVVEAGARSWIVSLGYFLEMYAEGVKKNGGNEEKYCEELRKRGAPKWIFPWLLRQMVYERRIPEGIFRAALDYLGKDVEKELGIGDALNYIFTSGGLSLIESLGLEERLRRITSGYERGDEEAEKNRERLNFLETFLGEGNLAYFQELVSIWFSKILKEVEENVTVGKAFEEAVEYARTLLEHVEQTLFSEKIGRLSDEEAQQVLEKAMEEYKTDDKELVFKRLAEKVITMSPEELRRYIDKLYDEKSKTSLDRSELTRLNYFKIYGALGLPPLNKRVCRVDFLRTLLKVKKQVDESATLGSYLSGSSLQKVLAEELSFYEMIEKEALRIYYGGIGEYSEIKESPTPRMKYLKDILDFSDIQYALEIFFTKLIPSQLISSPSDEKEAERIRKAVEEAVKYCGEVLEKTVDMLLNERIEKLNDEEIKHIIRLTKEIYLSESTPRFPVGKGEEEFNLHVLGTLARVIKMNMTKFRNYFRRKYNQRTRLTKYDYFRILEALKLNSTISKFHIDRKAFLKALFKVEKRASLEEQKTLSEEEKERLLGLHWSQQPFGTHCIFFEEDRRMLINMALRKCGNSVEDLAGRLLEEMGVEYITPGILRAFTEKRAVDVELVLALIGFIIGREPEEVVELIKGGDLAEVFKNSLLKQNLVDEENRDWLSNLPHDVAREVNLISLIGKFEKLTKKTGVEQDEMYNKFFVDLFRSELDKLKYAIKKVRGYERSNKKLYAYVAEKLNKHLKEEVKKGKIEGILRGLARINVGLYLSMCKIFGVKPNPELHFRSIRSLMRYLRRSVTEIDFLLPVVFTHRSGETIIIEESEKGFFVVTGGRRLRAEKWKTQYGGKLWGITIIDYVTEEGVFGVVKETGELCPPQVRPWYSHAQGRMVIGFKTARPIRNLIQTIQYKTGLSLKEISEITKIDEGALAGKLEGEMGETEKTITLGNLLTLLGLKSTITQTDIKREIRQLEKEICSMGEIEIPEEQKQNILYINLRTNIGASLIGHLYGDGYLKYRGKNILFSYYNTEQEYIEAVRSLLNFYGKRGNVHIREVEGEKHKEQHVVAAGGFLGYALWCAVPQAEGDKTVSNPKVPSWITGDPILAVAFLRAIISDEAHIKPKEKKMEISFSVNVTKILKEKDLLHVIQNIVTERLKELWKKWDSLGLSKEELTEEQINEERRVRTVIIDEVLKEELGEDTVNEAKKLPSNILIGVRGGLQTLKINSSEGTLADFYVSRDETVTARWRLGVYKADTGKVYERDLFEGYKKQNYERNYKRIVRRLRFDYKLTSEQLAEFRKIQEKIGGDIPKKVSISEVEEHWDSKRLGDFKEFINKYMPEDIKKKKNELEAREISAKAQPVIIYFGKDVISVEWELGWFEP